MPQGCVHVFNTEPCDNGNYCTFDRCSLGRCEVEELRNCDDADECTKDDCNEVMGVCEHVEYPTGRPCDWYGCVCDLFNVDVPVHWCAGGGVCNDGVCA
jgi:hypothetical protein